jgi:hypothetical protein
VTPTLLFARRLIIQWVTFWVAPFELAKGEGSDPLTSEKCKKPKVLILNDYSGWQPTNLRVGRSNRSGRATISNVQPEDIGNRTYLRHG